MSYIPWKAICVALRAFLYASKAFCLVAIVFCTLFNRDNDYDYVPRGSILDYVFFWLLTDKNIQTP